MKEVGEEEMTKLLTAIIESKLVKDRSASGN